MVAFLPLEGKLNCTASGFFTRRGVAHGVTGAETFTYTEKLVDASTGLMYFGGQVVQLEDLDHHGSPSGRLPLRERWLPLNPPI